MRQRAGLLLLVALLSMTAIFQHGRGNFFLKERPPAVSCCVPEGIWVELGDGFPEPGIHQFIDEMTPAAVIEVTLDKKCSAESFPPGLNHPLVSGEYLSIVVQGSEVVHLNRGWMNAGRRMVLAIPLRPETMSASDWEELPGIGPKLAARIESDRQINGEISSLSELKRVPGIGPKRLRDLEKYF